LVWFYNIRDHQIGGSIWLLGELCPGEIATSVVAAKDVGAVKARVTSLHPPLETARSAMGQETVQSAKVPAEADYLIFVSYP
jgi:hypothetical protein